MYSGVDLNWCFDFSASAGNADWLLPNRIYEGCLFHCPALVLSGTETTEWVKSKLLGWSLVLIWPVRLSILYRILAVVNGFP
jgi:succinoglycan biosynthesis protein ExoL